MQHQHKNTNKMNHHVCSLSMCNMGNFSPATFNSFNKFTRTNKYMNTINMLVLDTLETVSTCVLRFCTRFATSASLLLIMFIAITVHKNILQVVVSCVCVCASIRYRLQEVIYKSKQN